MEKAIKGEELVHYSHPQHPLFRARLPYLFICAACREYGAGWRFFCQACDFNLHDFCALAPPSLHSHPLHSQHPLVFFVPTAGGIPSSRCDVCAMAAEGLAFRCTSCSFVMHPCCSNLGAQMCFPVHAHPMRVATQIGSGGDGECGVCRSRRLGRVYICTVCDFQLHAVCAKPTINGLYASGIKPPEKHKSNKLLAAARAASQTLRELLGGLIEGIGEGLGEALVESIGRSRGSGTV